MKANHGDTDLEELARMEADYRQLVQQNNELDGIDPDLLAQMNESWTNYGDDLDGDFGLNDLTRMTKYDEGGIPILDPYEFGK